MTSVVECGGVGCAVVGVGAPGQKACDVREALLLLCKQGPCATKLSSGAGLHWLSVNQAGLPSTSAPTSTNNTRGPSQRHDLARLATTPPCSHPKPQAHLLLVQAIQPVLQGALPIPQPHDLSTCRRVAALHGSGQQQDSSLVTEECVFACCAHTCVLSWVTQAC